MGNIKWLFTICLIIATSSFTSICSGTDSTALSTLPSVSTVGAKSFLLQQGQSSGYIYYNVSWGGSMQIAQTRTVCPSGFTPQLNLLPMSTTWSSYTMRAWHALGNLGTVSTSSGNAYTVNVTAVSADMSGTGDQNIFLAWQVMCNNNLP